LQATDVNGISFILAARSRDTGDDSHIFVWKKASYKGSERDGNRASRIRMILTVAFQVIMLLASMAFVAQNFREWRRRFTYGGLKGIWQRDSFTESLINFREKLSTMGFDGE